MGMRIHTAIGWGMPFDRFQARCLLDLPKGGGDEWSQALEDALAGTGSMNGPYGRHLPITGPKDTVRDLMQFVGFDDYTDVVLFPTIGEARDWFRLNDDIDYAFHWGPRGPRDTDVPDNIVTYLEHGLHPYGNMRMDQTGADVPMPHRDDEARHLWERDPNLLPGVPRCLRRWVIEAEVLDLGGISELRPVRALWWS